MDDMSNAQPGSKTQQLIAELLLNNFQNIRTVHLVLSGFSIAASLLVILGIFNDARKAAKFEVALRPRRFGFFTKVHPAEVLPLALSVAIIIQQIVFLAVQASGMGSILVQGCIKTSQVVWPAIFIAPYTVLAFGLETTVRSLMRVKFAPRRKWNLYAILGFASILTIATWALSAVRSRHNACFASLPWWVGDEKKPAIVLLSLLMGVFVTLAFIIWVGLFRTVKIEPQERISASRDFYYLLLGAVLLSMVLPFYAQLSQRLSFNHFTSSMVAGVALTLTGLVNGFLHLVLRANAARMAIKPIQTPWQSKRSFRLFGPNDLEACLNISSPLGLIDPKDSDLEAAYKEKDLDLDYDASPRPELSRLDSDELQKALTEDINNGWPVIRAQQSVPPTPPPKGPAHLRNGSYSLFPTAASAADGRPISTPSEDETPNSLLPPRPFFSRRHKRESSAGSSATVQIGLRLSLAPSSAAVPRLQSFARALTSPRSPRSPHSPKSPGSPRSLTPRSPASPGNPSPLSREVSQDSTSTLAPLPSSFFTRPKRTTSLQQPPPHIVTQMKPADPMPAEPTPVLLTSRRYLDNVRSSGNAGIASTSTPSISEVMQPDAANGLRQNPPTPMSAVRPSPKERSPVWSPLLSPLRSPKSPLRSLNNKRNNGWI
ncbi:MAG: hypothetical protein M1822_004428 [Bathelium mastoideum]|nr:MAG: hypothetical protein M1822_004428 [Bathelium mastoideum]